MKLLRDTLAGNPITFIYLDGNSITEKLRLNKFLVRNELLGIDTESTGLNCFHPDWRLRMVQIGDDRTAIVIPAHNRALIERVMCYDGHWITHNGPHDFRCIDQYLGRETGAVSRRETHIVSHYEDSRNREEGGIGHKLKELACAYVDPQADKWERALYSEFKKIRVPTGELYKSGPKKGTEKTRIIKYSEGWALIDPTHPKYIKYAGADPILTYHVWSILGGNSLDTPDLYDRDCRLAHAMDRLHRRAIRLDVPYTEQLATEFDAGIEHYSRACSEFGCDNPNSNVQIANVLTDLGATITERTETGKPQTTDKVLRRLAENTNDQNIKDFVHVLLNAKQLSKRRKAYIENFLQERDANDRVHPSINILGARTARMSVSNPALQQLPTKDNSDDLDT